MTNKEVYELDDLELRKALAVLLQAEEPLREKLLRSYWEVAFAKALRENPQIEMTWKQRRKAREIVGRALATLESLRILGTVKKAVDQGGDVPVVDAQGRVTDEFLAFGDAVLRRRG